MQDSGGINLVKQEFYLQNMNIHGCLDCGVTIEGPANVREEYQAFLKGVLGNYY